MLFKESASFPESLKTLLLLINCLVFILSEIATESSTISHTEACYSAINEKYFEEG